MAGNNVIEGKLFSTLSVTAVPSNQEASGLKISLVLGETFTIMQVGYIKADGKLWKSDASANTTMPVAAMALAAGAGDATVTCLLIGIARNDDWNWSLGGEDSVLYASTTAGALSQNAPAEFTTTGDQVQAVGIATHADRIFFNPALTLVEVA